MTLEDARALETEARRVFSLASWGIANSAQEGYYLRIQRMGERHSIPIYSMRELLDMRCDLAYPYPSPCPHWIR